MQDDPLRKVAILVASLDEPSSEKILGSLPAQDARLVRQRVESLTDIDPDEQREVIAEFRRRLNPPSELPSDGVEIEASLLRRIDHQDYSDEVSHQFGNFPPVSDADASGLAEMLAGESLQTVALVLSRLDADRAAEVLGKLSREQQTEVLHRLEQLDDADEHAVAVIDAQINQWMATQRQRRERMAAGKQMVERLMSRTSMTNGVTVVTGKLPNPRAAVAEVNHISPERRTFSTPLRYERMPVVPQEAPRNPFDNLSTDECLSRLEQLSDEILLVSLCRLESQVASLALLGASEKLVKRVMRGLSRREAKLFRQQLRDMGPTRLGDILAAQQELLHTASQLD